MQDRQQDFKSWIQQGNFSHKRDMGITIPLIRQVEYENKNPASKIKKLCFFGYRDGNIRITISPKKSSFTELQNLLMKSGYPKPDFCDKDLNRYYLTIQNGWMLKILLEDLAILDESINEIAININQDLMMHINKHVGISGWIKNGEFGEISNFGTPLIREVSYDSCDANAAFKELHLFGYISGNFKFSIHAKEGASKDVIRFLTNLDEDFRFTNTALFKITTEKELSELLDTMKVYDKNISQELQSDVLSEFQKPKLALANNPNSFHAKKDVEIDDLAIQIKERLKM